MDSSSPNPAWIAAVESLTRAADEDRSRREPRAARRQRVADEAELALVVRELAARERD